MKREELEKEANKYADDYATPDLDCSFRAYMFEASKEGYLAGAEPREKRIAELEEQLNKAKKIISEWEDSFCCGADYLYLGNKGKELRLKSAAFLNRK